jgi:hypothetical protein
MFSCLPPDNGCEWADLREFVSRFNKLRGKAYYKSACLDKERRNTKEPEVLLEAPGEDPIVIERKSIVWPPGNEYLADHHKSHQLLDDFVRRLNQRDNPFTEFPYRLTVKARDLKGKGQREVARFAEEIADVVLSNPANAKSARGIGRPDPIPWRFRALSPHERDETIPSTGIGIEVWGDGMSETRDIPYRIEEEKSGYAKEFNRWADNAAEKFAQYAHCRKLLLVQFFGDSSLWMGDEEIVEIIKAADLPKMIDEVWVARQDWVSLNDYEIAWEHIR